MNDLLESWYSLLALYRDLPAGLAGKYWVRAAILATFFFAFCWTLERMYRTSNENYRTRNFFHDMTFWVFGQSGLHRLLFLVVIIEVLGTWLDQFGLAFAAGLSLPYKIVLFLLVNDFFSYWIHRAQHHFKFLWAFHAVHHSQERMTFATSGRIHPLEEMAASMAIFVPLHLTGLDTVSWLPLTLLLTMQIQLEHSRIPWRYGPLYKVLVSPVFHNFHHARDLEHRDRNFGQTFTIWDHLFGTTANESKGVPTVFGVEGVKSTTLLAALLLPFRLLRQPEAPQPKSPATTSS